MTNSQKYDVIIILGGGRDEFGNLTELSKQRLDLGAELFHQDMANKIFALGGKKSTYNPKAILFDKTGAELRANYLTKKDIPTKNIIKIEGGRDTIGEAFASRKVARENNFTKILVITSDKHLPRSLFVFKRIFGADFIVDGQGAPCGDLLNSNEEHEYLEVTKKLFDTLPAEIPDPESWETWNTEHADLYSTFKTIHTKYIKDDTETNQAYMGVQKK